jgi:hypothetical protein
MDTINNFIISEGGGAEYISYCIKQLTKEDQDLAKKYIKFPGKDTATKA